MDLRPDMDIDLRNIDVKLSISDVATISQAFALVSSIVPQSRDDIKEVSGHIADVLAAHFPQLQVFEEKIASGEITDSSDIDGFLDEIFGQDR